MQSINIDKKMSVIGQLEKQEEILHFPLSFHQMENLVLDEVSLTEESSSLICFSEHFDVTLQRTGTVLKRLDRMMRLVITS